MSPVFSLSRKVIIGIKEEIFHGNALKIHCRILGCFIYVFLSSNFIRDGRSGGKWIQPDQPAFENVPESNSSSITSIKSDSSPTRNQKLQNVVKAKQIDETPGAE